MTESLIVADPDVMQGKPVIAARETIRAALRHAAGVLRSDAVHPGDSAE